MGVASPVWLHHPRDNSEELHVVPSSLQSDVRLESGWKFAQALPEPDKIKIRYAFRLDQDRKGNFTGSATSVSLSCNFLWIAELWKTSVLGFRDVKIVMEQVVQVGDDSV